MASFNSRVALAVGGFVLVVVGVGAVALGTRGASHGSDPVSLNGPSAWLVSPSGGTAALLPTASGSPSRSASPAASASARRSSGPTGNPYAADAVLDDPTADPGPDPIFVRDADLRRTETYASRFSKPGDQVLAAGTYAFQYDVTTHALKTQLAARKAKLATATGIAIYLTGGAALSDTDLSTLQTVGRDLALPNLSRLYVYNLKTIQGGRQCTPDSGLACAGQTARGGLFPYLWFNGWWNTWVRHLVLDDLTAVPDGAFSNHNFAEVSLRSARSISA